METALLFSSFLDGFMSWRQLFLFVFVIGSLLSTANAQILPPGALPTLVAGPYNFTEGPLYDGNGGILFTNLTFSNLNNSDILRYDIAAGTTQNLVPSSGGANGLYRDLNGKIVSMDGATRRVSRRSSTNLNTIELVLASQFNGAAFNSPNDVVIDASGGIYFTDPDYNNNRSQPESVYYINSAGSLSRILTGFAANARPNGIALSPDQSKLYVALQAQGRIMSYDIISPGVVANGSIFATPGVAGPDGMTIDALGNLYGAVQNAVFAWNPAGVKLFEIPMPQNPTNVEFGPDGDMLYITAGTSLYRILLNVPAPPSADFDVDGDIDGRDFLYWQQNFGMASGATKNQGDANNDGQVNQADLEIWQEQYGTGEELQALNVPEPATINLLGAIVVLLTGNWRKLRK
jgi:gluconolactonase